MAATALAGELEILVPMAGLIDKEAEITRLEKEIGKLASDLARLQGKLNNAAFVDKAPVDVVDEGAGKNASATAGAGDAAGAVTTHQGNLTTLIRQASDAICQSVRAKH